MNYIDNRRWLGQHFREVAELVREWDDKEPTGDVIVEPSRKGDLTMQLNVNGTMKYVHSKYDPKKESVNLLKKFKGNGPVLFIGVGLGYHIEEWVRNNPNTKYALYEPNPEVFIQFLKEQKITTWNQQNVLGIFIGNTLPNSTIKNLVHIVRGRVQFVTLPIYKEIYSDSLRSIYKVFIEEIEKYKNNLQTDVAFQMRWVLNASKNFSKVCTTPNITLARESKQDTAFLVAAGPSLDQEIENLKEIKENELGYIFTVGSAINAVLNYDIYPHATFSYDPKERNARVIQKIKDLNISEIPLVFGSTIGHETLYDYPGDLYHFITSQDTVAPIILDAEEPIPIINDAPSIAVIALQVLQKMGFKKIVFIGQNLSYPVERRHAEGINYETFYNPNLSDEEKEKLFAVKDVYGNDVQTDYSMLTMKQQLEMYIKLHPSIKYINTTKGGASIDSTIFLPLEEVIEQESRKKLDVKTLFNNTIPYKQDIIQNKIDVLSKERDALKKQIYTAMDKLKIINDLVFTRQEKVLETHFGQFDQQYENITENLFYQTFIKQVIRVEHQELIHVINEVKYHNDIFYKGRTIVIAFNRYLNLIYKYYRIFVPIFEEMMNSILKEGES